MELKQALTEFGLDTKEQEVYLLLLKQNWITALKLSFLTSISRPTLYRVIERLIKRGLVEVQIGDKTTFYNATDPRQFEILVNEQEHKAKKLRNAFNEIQNQIRQLSSLKNKETRVNFYHGKRGLQNMEWKLCSKQNTEVLMFGSSKWYKILGHNFAEKWREEIVLNKVKIQELETPKNFEKIFADQESTWTKNTQYLSKHFRHRRIAKEKLYIPEGIFVHQDSIYFEGIGDYELVGIVITNKDFAQMLRQVFEHYWKEAEVLDKFG